MLYLERDQLCILHTKTERETISKEELKKPLLEKPCNLVYFETDQGLYGIVSSGDIFRTGGDYVTGSKVRKLAETCDPSIADLVPETTADVIFCQSINAIS